MNRCAAIAGLLLGLRAAAHEPITTKITWTREIEPLLARRCLSCHGEKAEVSLTRYEDARPWAKAIRDQVLTRAMPPWGAVEGFGAFQGDPSLTETERETVVEWVEGGAPEGDSSAQPMTGLRPQLAIPVLSEPFIAVNGIYTVQKLTAIKGVRPTGMQNGDEMRVTARLPNGRIEPLLWIRSSSAPLHDFVFKEPIELPARSAIRVECGKPCKAEIALDPPNPAKNHAG